MFRGSTLHRAARQWACQARGRVRQNCHDAAMNHEVILIESSPVLDHPVPHEGCDNLPGRCPLNQSSSPRLPSPSTFVKTRPTSPTGLAPRALQHTAIKPRQSVPGTRSQVDGNRPTEHPSIEAHPIQHTAYVDEPDSSPVRIPFSELVANFGYRTGRSPVANKSPENKQAILKRRKIDSAGSKVDIVEVGIELAAKPCGATLATSPKKKAPTITALATAAYRGNTDNDVEKPLSAEAEALRKTVAAAKRASKSSTSSAKKPRKATPSVTEKKRQRSKKAPTHETEEKATTSTKPRQRKSRTKTVVFREPNPTPILYSPEQAADFMLQQDFLFGTSSQLAVPESPTFIRQMQVALHESEVNGFPTEATGSNALLNSTSRRLWSSAARDMSGGLIRNITTVAKRPRKRITPKPRGADLEQNSGEGTAAVTGPPCSAQVEPPKSLSENSVAGHRKARTPKVRSNGLDHVREDEVLAEDISDDEVPPTPSPPRRRGKASPVPPPQLRLSPSHEEGDCMPSEKSVPEQNGTGEKDAEASTVLSTTAMLKITDTQWSTISPLVFQRISQVVQSTPPSTCLRSPTWHEKILLYDPIVIEDFLSWLTEQGVRVPTKRKIKKTKQKATAGRRKKKQDAHVINDVNQVPTDLVSPDTEIIDELLQPWMVQKWCEERSICCMFKDGAGFRPAR